MSEFPQQWETRQIGDVLQVARGGSPRPIKNFLTDDPEGLNWIKISDATAGGARIKSTREKIKPEGLAKTRAVAPGDFLLSNSMSFGRPYITEIEGCIHDGWLVLKGVGDVFDEGFLYHCLRSETVQRQFDQKAAGTTVRNLNSDLVRSVTIPIPPLAEQRRIVVKLDRLSARTKAARAHLARVQSLAIRAKQATLTAAFRGDLTGEWRKLDEGGEQQTVSIADLNLDGSERGTWSSDDLPSTWEWKKFRDAFVDLTDSRRKLPRNKYLEDGEFIVVDQGAELIGGKSDARDLVHTAKPPVIIFGDHTRCLKYIYQPFIQGADGVKVLQASPELSIRFAFWALNTVELPDKGYSRHMKFLKASVFPVPPKDEQAEIVRRIEAAFARIDRMVEDAERTAHLLDRLDQRLLAKAFRGELVPQDPNDEPAAELLARIEAARAAAPNPKRGRRQRA